MVGRDVRARREVGVGPLGDGERRGSVCEGVSTDAVRPGKEAHGGADAVEEAAQENDGRHPRVATRSILRRSFSIRLPSHAPTTAATPKKMNVVARSATSLLFDETLATTVSGYTAAMTAGM